MTYPDAVRALAAGAYIPAIATFHGHLSCEPADGQAWMYLGIAYSETGFQAESLRALERARLIMDDSAELDEAIGCTFLRMDDYETAQTYFWSATRYTDCPASVHRNLSILLLKTHRFRAALGAVDTALEKDPDDVLTLYAKLIILKRFEYAGGVDVTRKLELVLEDILRRRHVPPGIREQAAHLRDELGSRWR